MKDALLSLLGSLGLAYWVKITTDSPSCIYYFGPFSSEADAQAAQGGFCEDLRSEGAQDIAVVVERRRKPQDLTVTDDWGEADDWKKAAVTALAS